MSSIVQVANVAKQLKYVFNTIFSSWLLMLSWDVTWVLLNSGTLTMVVGSFIGQERNSFYPFHLGLWFWSWLSVFRGIHRGFIILVHIWLRVHFGFKAKHRNGKMRVSVSLNLLGLTPLVSEHFYHLGLNQYCRVRQCWHRGSRVQTNH